MSDDGDRTSAPPRALRLLVDELRAAEPPALDWDRMESRLLARIDGVAGREERPEVVDTSGVVDLLGAAPAPQRREPVTEPPRAEVLVPWDDEPEDEPWKALRRPPAEEATVRRRPPAVAGPAPGRRWAAAFAAVVAVVAAGWVLAPSQPVAPPQPVDLAAVAREPRLEGALDLASLRGGDVVEAAEGPVRFGREGVLSWTLSAGGRLRVVTGIGHEEPRHVVALDAGALDVEVVPRASSSDAGPVRDPAAPAERFVVEVGDARVAVHGTAFRVVRSTQGIVVDVARGVVAVGPRDGAPGSGQRLEGPQRAAFGLDGRGYRALPRRTADAASSDERYAAASVELSAVGDPAAGGAAVLRAEGDALGPRESQPSGSTGTDRTGSGRDGEPGLVEPRSREPGVVAGAPPSSGAAAATPATGERGPPAPAASPGSTEASVRRISAEVTGCIRRAGAASSDARVTVSSSLVVDVDASGVARSVRFDPPIRPDLQACAQPVFQRRFGGAGHLVVPIEVVLEPR